MSDEMLVETGVSALETVIAALPVAVQLYTLRSLTAPIDQVLAAVAAAGYAGVELAGTYGLAAAHLRDLLDRQGLAAASAHVSLADLEADLPSIIRYHKILGNDTLVVPWLPVALRSPTAAGWQTMGRRLNQLGRRCQMAGMRLLYHNHDFEMELLDGQPAIAWLLEAAEPENLGFEPDLAWIVAGGQDAPGLLARFAGRCLRIHAKDLGDDPEEHGLADVGAGRLAWDELLPAVVAAGAEWLVVEHDHPRDPIASMRRSREFLDSKMRSE
jgi:sugar phosphate isomerase/epimerase